MIPKHATKEISTKIAWVFVVVTRRKENGPLESERGAGDEDASLGLATCPMVGGARACELVQKEDV
jgi:hypothetical protein